MCTIVLALQLATASRRTIILGFVGFLFVLLALVSRHTKQVLLFAWVLALTYNRNFFSFDGLFGDSASQGLYWIPADLFLLALFGLWVYEATVLKRTQPAQGRPLWPWYSPFVLACTFTIFTAEHKDWTLFELVRVVKLGSILYYLRYNLGRKELLSCISGLASAVLLQVSYSVALMMNISVMSVFGAAGEITATYQSLGEGLEEWKRATGTLAHPNILACYLLLLFPAFVSLGLTFRQRLPRLLCAITGLAGLAGIALTQSRAAWLLAPLQAIILLLGLAGMGLVSAKRVIALISLSALFIGIVTAIFWQKVEDRLSRDFTESVEFRTRYDRIALDIITRSPFVGIGLNNYSLLLAEYDPEEVAKYQDQTETLRQVLHIRAIAAVHNLYLLLLAETGILGLGAFLVFLIGTFGIGIRAICRTTGDWRGICLGLLVGIIGVLGHQMTEFSLWIDSTWYTFAIVVGMLNNIPYLAAAESLRDKSLETTEEIMI